MTNKLRVKKQKINNLHDANIRLVALYLLDATPYYYEVALGDAQHLFDTNSKEFNKTLKSAIKFAKENA